MSKNINSCISLYKEQVNKSNIQKTYMFLLKYLMQVKASFEKAFSKEYSCGNISPGYLDFSYFPFYNDYLRDKKLRFGIVLNHSKMRFELWLMGQNKEIQKRYWDMLEASQWNQGRSTRPQYAELEIVLVDNPNFENTDALTVNIINMAVEEADKIIAYLKKLDLST
jgi:hypothetical protein